jgi:hypothetical protein
MYDRLLANFLRTLASNFVGEGPTEPARNNPLYIAGRAVSRTQNLQKGKRTGSVVRSAARSLAVGLPCE